MNRRDFLRWSPIAAAVASAAVQELVWTPRKTLFLPPACGWLNLTPSLAEALFQVDPFWDYMAHGMKKRMVTSKLVSLGMPRELAWEAANEP